MDKLESNSALIVNFFKQNYIKIIFFILIAILINLFLTFQYNKKNSVFYSKFKIIFNQAVNITSPINLMNPIKDFLFYLEKKGALNKKVLRSRHANPIIQIEINHKGLDDKQSEQYDKYLKYFEDYKKELLSTIENNIQMYIKNTEKKLITENKENLREAFELNVLKYTNNARELKRMITNNEIIYIQYDGIIHSRKANTLLLKNSLITLCICIFIISLILWIKIFLREIKKNS